MGDPAGVGPEILVKALAEASFADRCRPIVLGSIHYLQPHSEQLGLGLEFKRVKSIEAGAGHVGIVEVLEPVNPVFSSIHTGKVTAESGRVSVGLFEESIRLALAKQVAGIVTCPINKEAVHLAGYVNDIGHQEILARMTGAELTATMLMTGGLKVAHLSTHKSLGDAVGYVRKDIIVEKLLLTIRSLRKWGTSNPKVAVAALNPHGGEGGMLGREEIEEIGPAVAAVREMGEAVVGPLPADSVFYRAINGEFDAVLALYHDQGHIAIKVHNFEQSITATMGIPFVRTSVDHGTAFDIAGKYLASHQSLLKAMDTAINMIHGTL
jgi:4-hydroxythreonine-4-phosphate dehydrogenase